MLRKQLMIGLIFILGAISLSSAQETVSTKEILRDRLEKAIKAKDQEAINKLYCWDGLDEKERSLKQVFIIAALKHEISSVTLMPLPSDYKAQYT